VGAIALARDDISDTLPGVAIAISLVPPLAVVGLTLESGAPEQAAGALLLFVANVSAILATGLLVMGVYRVHHHMTAVSGDGRQVHRGRAVVAIVLGLVVVAIPLTAVSVRINSTRTTESDVRTAATSWATGQGWMVASVTTQPSGVLVRVSGPLPEPDTAGLQSALDAGGLGDVKVLVELIPSHSVELGPSG
jgi:uncharacterized membrane protein